MSDLNANQPRAGILSEEIAAMHPGERFQLMFKNELEMNEKNELLEAALKLAELATHPGACVTQHNKDEVIRLVEIIERHRPKPERLECWMNIANGVKYYFDNPSSALSHGSRIDAELTRHAVHLREVVPVEFEKWTGDELRKLRDLHPYGSTCFDLIAQIHNEAMERIANA